MRPSSRIRIAPDLIIRNVYPTDNISKWSRCRWTYMKPGPRIRMRIEDTPWPYLPTMCCVLMMWQWDHVTIYICCVEMVWQYTMYMQCSDIGWQWNDLTILLSHWPFPLCADNQTLTHNQNILSQPRVQHTTQCNQISRTQNITKQHPRNKNQTKPTLLGLRQDAFTVIGL